MSAWYLIPTSVRSAAAGAEGGEGKESTCPPCTDPHSVCCYRESDGEEGEEGGGGGGGKDYRTLSMSPVISRFVEGNLRGRPADAIRDRAGLKPRLKGTRSATVAARSPPSPPRFPRHRLGKIGIRSIPSLSADGDRYHRDIRCRAVDPLRILCSSRETGTGLNRRSREPSPSPSHVAPSLRVLGIRMWYFYIDRHPISARIGCPRCALARVAIG